MKSRAVWIAVCLVGLLAVVGAAASSAAAESFCTDTWTGPSEGSWETSSNWSAGTPTSSSVACLPSGTTVWTGNAKAAVVQDEGHLLVSNVLELGELLSEPSRIANLTIDKTAGVKTSAAVNVTHELVGEGYINGGGSLVIASSATGYVAGVFGIYGTKLKNEGTFTVGQNAGVQGEGATLENVGTLIVNADNGGENHSLNASKESFLINTGTIERTEVGGATEVGFSIENRGTVRDETGILLFNGGGKTEGNGGNWTADAEATIRFTGGPTTNVGAGATFTGSIEITGSKTAVSGLHAENASVTVTHPSGSQGTTTLEAYGSTPSVIRDLTMKTLEGAAWSPSLYGPGTVEITKSFYGGSAYAVNSGVLLIRKGASATIGSAAEHILFKLASYTLRNYGTLEVNVNSGIQEEKAQLINYNVLTVNGEPSTENHGIIANGTGNQVVNYGTFQKTEGSGTTLIVPEVFNYGRIHAYTGKFRFEHPVWTRSQETQYGARNKSALSSVKCKLGDPVSCETGNFSESQADIAIGGRGVGLDLSRYYNAQAAAAGEKGVFGYGWTNSFSAHLTFNAEAHTVTAVQDEGATVTFAEEGGKLVAPAWTQDTLTGSGSEGYTLTMNDQTVYRFSGAGRLESVTDRNGNVTGLGYNEKGQLATITDPSGRKVTLAYNAEGLVESATDPMSHVVKYAYEAGQLTSVTLPSQTSPRWRFKYDTSHRIVGVIDGRGNETTNTYNSASQVIAQKDFAGHLMKWEYEPFVTKVTNESTGSVTLEEYTSEDEIAAVTRGYGTAKATTESFTYSERGEPLTRTDGNGHTTSYEYDSEGDRITQTDPEGHETRWTYDSKHEITSETLPSGEKTTIEYDERGNPVRVSRPAPEEKTQVTRYEYNSHGAVTAMIDPLERKWTYGYDEAGDRTSETDPEGDKTTWAYNKNSVLTSEVRPRGNVTGGKPVEYTTTFTRDVLGRLTKVTQPEGQETKYVYNADDNPIEVTDPNGHKTTINYTPDGLPSKVTQANGSVAETNYNGANLIITQIDGNKHSTKYIRNALGQVVEIIDPLEHKTKETYDAAGNLATLVDASSRTTTYSYNKENEPIKVRYSETGLPAVEYGHTPNGQISSMVDGTGTTSYTYDQLGRLTETKNGHGDTVGYGYDLANEITSVKYPNAKTVKDGYDKAGRLSSVSDWLSHTVSFAYNPDSQPIATAFPEATGGSDHYVYNRTDQQTEASMLKGSETLASIAYLRDLNGQATKETQTGLPGEAAVEYGYDVNERLTKAGATAYEYDPANNPTKIGTATNTFNAADQLTEGGGVTYAYNTVGQRTKATPTTGPASTYGYNQAGVLTSVNRPEEGSIPKIEDSYAYDGNDLRASETTNGTTKHLTWQLAGGLPLLLSDGSNSYIYGPEGLPVEQINGEEHATYLHHDQQGSTRLLTNEKGETSGKCSYSAYGTPSCEGPATTPLGYDGQYTTPDTGLIYLRARIYDPATAQFLSVDPAAEITRAPYAYASDSPLTFGDPTGLGEWEPWTESFWTKGNFISKSPLNPIPYYEKEIESYENGCGYFASVAHGVEGAFAGAALFAGGEGESELGADVAASTGRTVASDLNEQLAMEEAMSDPAAGLELRVTMTDSRWPASEGWVKMAQNVNGVEIHYVRNVKTGATADWKYVP